MVSASIEGGVIEAMNKVLIIGLIFFNECGNDELLN